MTIRLQNSYARLPERFYARQRPAAVPAPRLIRLNAGLARELGLDPDWLASPAGVAFLSGRDLPEGAEPLAMAYAGHQFGGFSPSLGDGRALLLGEIPGPDGQPRDIHLKGSGRTPFSRMGDGLAALGPVLREYVIGEAMHALGIPTTRALAALATGGTVLRERPLPGAILVRVARSHVRVGTFQYFAARGDAEALAILTDHVTRRLYPEAARAASPALALLEAVIAAQARLIARWMAVGFIHGVMNTDNMSIAGETIDYGPCAFMDSYHPATVYSSIDHQGRYAYGNQPVIAQWNLVRFAEALLALIHPQRDRAVALAQEAVDRFPALYRAAWEDAFRAKLGLATAREGDGALAEALLSLMQAAGADFTLTFRALADAVTATPPDLARRMGDAPAFEDWARRWRERLAAEGRDAAAVSAALKAANPAVIPRNHLVEQALVAAEGGDLGPLDALLDALARPFDDRAPGDRMTLPPRPGEEVRQTFCGT